MQLGAIAGVGIGTGDTFWVRFSAWIWDLFVSNAPTTTSVMAPRPCSPRSDRGHDTPKARHQRIINNYSRSAIRLVTPAKASPVEIGDHAFGTMILAAATKTETQMETQCGHVIP